jgi:hypothetical protein
VQAAPVPRPPNIVQPESPNDLQSTVVVVPQLQYVMTPFEQVSGVLSVHCVPAPTQVGPPSVPSWHVAFGSSVVQSNVPVLPPAHPTIDVPLQELLKVVMSQAAPLPTHCATPPTTAHVLPTLVWHENPPPVPREHSVEMAPLQVALVSAPPGSSQETRLSPSQVGFVVVGSQVAVPQPAPARSWAQTRPAAEQFSPGAKPATFGELQSTK